MPHANVHRAIEKQSFTTFAPGAQQEKAVGTMLDQVVAWGTALKTLH